MTGDDAARPLRRRWGYRRRVKRPPGATGGSDVPHVGSGATGRHGAGAGTARLPVVTLPELVEDLAGGSSGGVWGAAVMKPESRAAPKKAGPGIGSRAPPHPMRATIQAIPRIDHSFPPGKRCCRDAARDVALKPHRGRTNQSQGHTPLAGLGQSASIPHAAAASTARCHASAGVEPSTRI
jgi:hypothetical protein